jgi:hypothetical protein
VLVCGVTVVELDPVDADEPLEDDPSSLDENPSSPEYVRPLEYESSDELPDDEVPVADELVECCALAVAGWLSVHAIAVPSDSAAATLTAPITRRARLALGGLRGRGSVMGGLPVGQVLDLDRRYGARVRQG